MQIKVKESLHTKEYVNTFTSEHISLFKNLRQVYGNPNNPQQQKQDYALHTINFAGLTKVHFWEFPGGLVVRILGFHCCGPGSVLGQGTEISLKPLSGQPTEKEEEEERLPWCGRRTVSAWSPAILLWVLGPGCLLSVLQGKL